MPKRSLGKTEKAVVKEQQTAQEGLVEKGPGLRPGEKSDDACGAPDYDL